MPLRTVVRKGTRSQVLIAPAGQLRKMLVLFRFDCACSLTMIATLAAGLEEQIVADVVAALCAKAPLRESRAQRRTPKRLKTHAESVVQIESSTGYIKAEIVADDALRSLRLEQT